jgi:CHAT domain-containing protein/tetratricopeptide (TPR) repeat protein
MRLLLTLPIFATAGGRRALVSALAITIVAPLSASQRRGWPSEEVRRQYRAAEAEASKLVRSDPERGVKAREDMLAWSIRLFGPDHDETAVAQHNLGYAYLRIPRYDLALPRFQRAYELHLRNWGRRHVNVGKTLLTIGVTYSDLGQYKQAEDALLAARQILGEVGDHNSRSMANFDLSLVYQNERRFPESLKILLEEREYRLRTAGAASWPVANVEKQLGELYQIMGDFANGERMVRSAIARSVQIAKVPNSGYFGILANNLIGLGRYDEAYEAAQVFGKGGSLTASEGRAYVATLRAVACGYLAAKCPNGLAQMDEAMRLHRRASATIMAGLPEPQQLTYLTTVDKNLHDALSLAIASPTDAALTERSAEWLLNGKARLHESMAERALLVRDTRDQNSQSVSSELARVRQQIATLVHSAPGDPATLESRIALLQVREAELSRRLAESSGRASDTQWFDWKQLRSQIPADSVLLDILRISVRNYRARSGIERSDRYVAWVTHPVGKSAPVRIIDLGEARLIDGAVKKFQDTLTDVSKMMSELQSIRAPSFPVAAEKALETSFRTASSALTRLVVDPLRPAIGTTRNWIISPDGNLWAIPWATLWQGDPTTGRYLIQDHFTSYAVSARDLLQARPKVTTTAPVVFAAPDYDLGVSAARQQTAAVLGTRASPAAPAASRPMLQAGSAVPLPETAIEAQKVAPTLAKWARAQPTVYLQARALEGVFKVVRSPKVIYLSTHGFFWDLPERTDKYRAGSSLLENPLLRCGLLLASCNRREARQPNDDDGVLTGAEIVGTDLRGTELAVLSACQTGLGDVWAGQSAAGLRQAFQLAGARSVLASLWSVPSAESVDVMDRFFQNLAAGQSKPAAINNSALQLLLSRQKQRGTAHPYFWGTFTLTGRAD